jgi:hypothetical protein
VLGYTRLYCISQHAAVEFVATMQQAALNYAAAHELETEEGREQPSPYARLNQLTLEMLAGDGSERER